MKRHVIRLSVSAPSGERHGELTLSMNSAGGKVMENLRTPSDHRRSILVIDRRGLVRAFSKVESFFRGGQSAKRIWLRRKGKKFWIQHEKLGESWAHEISFPKKLSLYVYTSVSLFPKPGKPIGWRKLEAAARGYLEKLFPGDPVTRTEIRSMGAFPIFRNPPPLTLTYSSQRPVGMEKTIRIRSFDGKKLFGVWEHSRTTSGRPTVILVHGSGPETGDSGSGYEGRDYQYSPHQPFREVSRKLVSRGYPVFRFDKRGTGRSDGDFDRTTRTVLLRDLLAVIEHVASLSKGPVLILGFSEGASLALSAALHSRRVRAIALAGSPAHSIDQVILLKLAIRLRNFGWKGNAIKMKLKEYRELFDRIRLVKKIPGTQDIHTQILGYSVGWWSEHLHFIPSEEAKKVRCPILLMHGTEDAEVLVGECKSLSSALRAAKVPHDLALFKGLNHFFTPTYSRYPGFEYEVPIEIPDRFFEKFVNWADQLVT